MSQKAVKQALMKKNVELPPKEGETYSVGTFCYYAPKTFRCWYCLKEFKPHSLVFTNIYDVNDPNLAFSGFYDVGCFFRIFRLKSYLRVDGFHELSMPDRIRIEDKIEESRAHLKLLFNKQLNLTSSVKLRVLSMNEEDLRYLVTHNLSGTLDCWDVEFLVGIACDMLCFGAIIDVCPGCKGQLIPKPNKYICLSDVVKYSTTVVTRRALDCPNRAIIEPFLEQGLCKPKKRLLAEKN